jgi:hypothetical protein
MRKKKVGAIAIKSFALLVVLGTAYLAKARDATTTYPSMAPIASSILWTELPRSLWRKVQHRSPFHAMQRSWFLDVMVSKQRSKEKTVSCVPWNVRGLPHPILTFGIRKCGCRNV